MRTTWLVVGLVVTLAGCTSTDAKSADALSSSPSKDVPSPAPAAPANTPGTPAAPKPREITLPAGTVLPVTLNSSVGSDTSRIEDPVRATVRRAVVSQGVEVLPAGTAVTGYVTQAQRSGRVKGRASIAFRFTQIDLPGEGGRTPIKASTISRLAPATKKQDAMKIGGGAAGGAIIGGILGGGDGAAKGAAIGGGAGTGVVLATRGKEVHVGSGSALGVRLTAPLTVRVK